MKEFLKDIAEFIRFFRVELILSTLYLLWTFLR